MGTKLFSTTNRDEAHRFLDRVLDNGIAKAGNESAVFETTLSGHVGVHPHAECREDPNAPEPYMVWSGPVDRDAELVDARAALALVEAKAAPALSPDETDALKRLLGLIKDSL